MQERPRSDDGPSSARDRAVYVTVAVAIIVLTGLLAVVLF